VAVRVLTLVQVLRQGAGEHRRARLVIGEEGDRCLDDAWEDDLRQIRDERKHRLHRLVAQHDPAELLEGIARIEVRRLLPGR
jgi:hypothetical protein